MEAEGKDRLTPVVSVYSSSHKRGQDEFGAPASHPWKTVIFKPVWKLPEKLRSPDLSLLQASSVQTDAPRAFVKHNKWPVLSTAAA